MNREQEEYVESLMKNNDIEKILDLLYDKFNIIFMKEKIKEEN